MQHINVQQSKIVKERFRQFSVACLGAAALTLVGLLVGTQPVFATNNCLQDEYNTFTKGKLVCTANDVRIAQAQNPRAADGTPVVQCTQGQPVTFIADFLVVTTATARENIGLYLSGNGASALTGSCTDNIISPLHAPGKATANQDLVNFTDQCFVGLGPGGVGQTPQCLGTTQYEELDPQVDSTGNPLPDNCGDISTADNNQIVTIQVTALCVPGPDGNLALPNCTSWQQPGGTIQCLSDPNQGWPYPTPSGVAEAIPGSPSKCNCSTVSVPILVQSGKISVTKTANPTTVTEPGGPVTYTTTATNQSNFGSVVVHQICDNKYDTIDDDATLSACAAGTLGAASNISCTKTLSGTTTSVTLNTAVTLDNPGDFMTCTFTGNATGTEGSTVTDTVTWGVKAGTTLLGNNTASASVTIGEATAKATLKKTVTSGITNLCVTTRYQMEIDNTGTADEDLSLSALNDTVFGDVTKVQTGIADKNVVGTTCGVDTTKPGLGTLSGQTGAGTLPAP